MTIEFKCIDCNRLFSTSKILRRHLLEKHPVCPEVAVEFACLHCSKIFTRASNMQRHVNAVHVIRKVQNSSGSIDPEVDGNSGIGCSSSNGSSSSSNSDSSNNNDNIINNKNGNGGAKVGKADKQVSNKELPKSHFCLTCGAKFRQMCHLREHMLTHAGVKFECDVCGKTFSRLRTWRSHKEKFHDWDPKIRHAQNNKSGIAPTRFSAASVSLSPPPLGGGGGAGVEPQLQLGQQQQGGAGGEVGESAVSILDIAAVLASMKAENRK